MSPRSWKQFYGADIDVNVKCLKCGEAIDLTGDVEEQASYFTEVY